MIGNDPASKFQAVPSQYLLEPGSCASCGKVYDERGFADTKLDFEMYGVVYFCSDCVLALANVFDDALHYKLIAENRALQQTLDTERQRMAEMEATIDSLTLDRLRSRSVPVYSEPVSPVVVQDEPAEPEASSDDADESGELDSELTESVEVDGPDDTDDTSVSDNAKPSKSEPVDLI